MGIFSDLLGTTASYFKIGLTGVRLKNSSANLVVRNNADSADAEITASKVNVSGNDLVLNSDAAGSSADWLYTLRVPASGMAGAVILTLPPNNGSPNQVLGTDGDGNLAWVDAGDTSSADKMEVTELAHGDSSPVTMFNLPVDNIVQKIQVIVDTAFNGSAPTMSVGFSGSASAYMPATAVDLKTIGIYEYHPGVPADDTDPVALEIAYTADSSSAGAARVIVFYGEPA